MKTYRIVHLGLAPLIIASLAWTVAAAQSPAAPPALSVRPFPRSDVRLLPGLFKDGQDIAVKYLLSFEPDRFLANFRKTAGLTPKAPHYGGWESQGVCGHSAGHYLSRLCTGIRGDG